MAADQKGWQREEGVWASLVRRVQDRAVVGWRSGAGKNGTRRRSGGRVVRWRCTRGDHVVLPAYSRGREIVTANVPHLPLAKMGYCTTSHCYVSRTI
jgi:hypothetical protein